MLRASIDFFMEVEMVGTLEYLISKAIFLPFMMRSRSISGPEWRAQ